MLLRSRMPLLILPPLLLGALAVGARAQRPAPPIRTLIFSGMNNHEWQQTTPALQRIFEASGRFAVDITEDPASCDAAKLAQYDLVVSNWTNYPSDERAWGAATEQAVLDSVRKGRGFVLFHAAAACFFTWPEYHQLIGAIWDRGATGHGAIHSFGVKIADQAHPIAGGLKDFVIRDELWHRMALDPGARILCTAFSAEDTGGTGQDEPVALVTRFGGGRCFNLVLGHDVQAMTDYDWRLLMLRGSEWAATGQVTVSLAIDTDRALDAASTYEHYQSRAPLAEVEELVRQASTDLGLRRDLAAKLVERLSSDATDDCKAFLLRQLSLIGDSREVPAVATLVGHKTLGPFALSALERMPAAGVSAALRQALPDLDGPALAGAINALGQRRDAKAAPAIALHLTDGDDVIAQAAIDALGKIGGAAAIEALQRFAEHASPAYRAIAAGALLECADRLAADGERRRATSVCADLLGPEYPDHVRMAAFVGLVTCSPNERTMLLLDALRGEDSALNGAAARGMRTLGDGKPARAIAGELLTFRPAVQVQVLNAFRDLGEGGVAPAVADAVSSDDPEVRLAAVRALGRLGDASTYPALVQALRAEPSDAERQEIERSLAGVCGRAMKAEGALPFTQADLAAEGAAARASLLRVLGMLGDERSLGLLRASLRGPAADTRLAAVRALSEWPDGTPMADLLTAARLSEDAAERSEALWGIAGLAAKALADPEATLRVLGEATALAEDVEEKRALLGSLGLLHHPDALTLAAASFEDEPVSRDACLAAVQVAENLPASHRTEIEAAMKRVLAVGDQREQITTRAKGVLIALGVPVDVTRSAALVPPGLNLALGATASSPDGIDSDGAASGDQAAIDGDPATYWDEADNQELYRLKVTFESPQGISAIRITGYQQHSYAPKDFEILCDDKPAKTVEDAWYESNQFAVTFPPTRCTSLELKITGCYGASPAIRELEVYSAGTAQQ